MATLLLSVMRAFAEFERALIRERQREGVALAKQRGAYRGRKKALNAAERARQKKLTEKLLAKRQEVVETEKGYEFQFRPEDVSVAEVAEWVVMESKCCAFFDFHIDLENEGKLVCLRLTGNKEVKQFIRSEFGIH